jgi:hypothetical protein
LCVEEQKYETEIAGILNAERITGEHGRPWNRWTVNTVLTNEKYIGHNIYNKKSIKLKQKAVRNPPDMWVRFDDAFAPIVDATLFEGARRLIEARNTRLTDQEMLARLKALLLKRGALSMSIIDQADDMPSSSAYCKRFGGLVRAFEAIDYQPQRNSAYVKTLRSLRGRLLEIASETVAGVERAGGKVSVNESNGLLLINEEFTVLIAYSRCFRTSIGLPRWSFRLNSKLRPDITILARLDPSNQAVLDYYFLPRMDLGFVRFRLSEENAVYLEAYRHDTLSFIYALSARHTARSIA